MHGLGEKAEDMVEMGAQSCIGFIKKCSKIGYVVVKSTEDPFLLLPECVAIENTPHLMFLVGGLCGIGT